MTLSSSKGYKQVLKWLKEGKKKPFIFPFPCSRACGLHQMRTCATLCNGSRTRMCTTCSIYNMHSCESPRSCVYGTWRCLSLPDHSVDASVTDWSERVCPGSASPTRLQRHDSSNPFFASDGIRHHRLECDTSAYSKGHFDRARPSRRIFEAC